ncbi:hypothetical protein [Flavicella sediminum]|uniref:hypothetical protein n=1 Tax=Flavicella sediminum TaxID=2585141 RepID=UPI00111EB9CA|nr:hypothetical protein [Flavicella sediminum]
MIITLLAGIIGTVLLAFLIIKFVPLKLRWLVSLLLLSLAGYLGYSIYDSIMGPIRFNIEKKARYAKVIEHLKMIRDAEDAHKTITGYYQKNGERLIKFLDTAQFAIINTRNEVVEVNKGTKWQPIMVEVEQKVIDTTGYESVKETLFKGRDYTKMLAVPGTSVNFEINTGFIQKVAGLQVPVFEAKVDKAILLKGMDPSLVKQEREAIGGDEVKGAFLAVGSLEEVNSNGNWPPFYDKAK